MPSTTEPRSGIKFGWALGESGWNTENDENLRKLGRLSIGGGILDRDLTDPPLSPVDGDAYIPAASATGDWMGREDTIAIWDGTAWVFYTAPDGFGIYILDENVYSIYKSGSGWSNGVSHSWV